MPVFQQPNHALAAWAVLNDVGLDNVRVKAVEGKGHGLVASKDLPRQADDGQLLLRVPRDLVLSAEAVEGYAKSNQNLRQLLDAAGRRSVQGDIKLYLLTQIALSKSKGSPSGGRPLTPWTEYIKFLPSHVPLPTMWTAEERELLRGTSLETAVATKLAALAGEFERIREKSSELGFWFSLLWENETARLEDWILADALYRSRCVELPEAGEAMVPVLDMANHSHHPTARYGEDSDGNVVLVRQCGGLRVGEEVTISYGSEKTAAEMLFSYGFVDGGAAHGLILPLDALEGDPVGEVKLRMLREAPTVRVWQEGGTFRWESPAAYLLCLNHEDGLDFHLVQDTAGGRELRLLWLGEDVTGRSGEFEGLVRDHALCQVFRLRVAVTVLGRVRVQLDRMGGGYSRQGVSAECIQAAEALRRVESAVLEGVAGVLEEEKAMLLADEGVLAYLGQMEDVGSEGQHAPGNMAASNEDDDFS